MLQAESQAEVLDILQNFSGSTEPLKQLFWSTLNYDRVNQSITRHKWPEPAASILADDPTLFAAGGTNGKFQVLYSRLAKDRLSLSEERIVTSRLLKDHPYSLFVFSDLSQASWHFLNVKYAEQHSSRRLFRRLTIAGTERLRTASEVLTKLDVDGLGKPSSKLSPLEIQQVHDDAFDVEPVASEGHDAESPTGKLKHYEPALVCRLQAKEHRLIWV
jgi:hypothetical protein